MVSTQLKMLAVSKLVLNIAGGVSREMDFELLQFDESLSFEINCKLRQYLVDSLISEMEVRYKNLIENAGRNYHFVLTHDSKINNNVHSKRHKAI